MKNLGINITTNNANFSLTADTDKDIQDILKLAGMISTAKTEPTETQYDNSTCCSDFITDLLRYVQVDVDTSIIDQLNSQYSNELASSIDSNEVITIANNILEDVGEFALKEEEIDDVLNIFTTNVKNIDEVVVESPEYANTSHNKFDFDKNPYGYKARQGAELRYVNSNYADNSMKGADQLSEAKDCKVGDIVKIRHEFGGKGGHWNDTKITKVTAKYIEVDLKDNLPDYKGKKIKIDRKTNKEVGTTSNTGYVLKNDTLKEFKDYLSDEFKNEEPISKSKDFLNDIDAKKFNINDFRKKRVTEKCKKGK